MPVVVIGLATGLVGTVIMTRVCRSMLFGVGPADPVSFLFGCAILASGELFACHIPARSAGCVEFLIALRKE